MDYNQVKNLLDKYWEGESSIEEERALKKFFSLGEVPEEWKEHQDYFQFLKTEKQVITRPGFETKLIQQLKKKSQPVRRRSLMFNLLKVAALVVMFWTALSYFQKDNSLENKVLAWEDKYEPEDPQEAYRQTKAALYLLSSKLNKGTGKAIQSVNRVKESTKIFK